MLPIHVIGCFDAQIVWHITSNTLFLNFKCNSTHKACKCRYFGGTKLGAGGLVRAYGGAARECLREAETIVHHPKQIVHLKVMNLSLITLFLQIANVAQMGRTLVVMLHMWSARNFFPFFSWGWIAQVMDLDHIEWKWSMLWNCSQFCTLGLMSLSCMVFDNVFCRFPSIWLVQSIN